MIETSVLYKNAQKATLRYSLLMGDRMSENEKLPDILYKYLDSSGMVKFLNSPGVLFSSVATFSDSDEGVCASWLPDNQTESMIHKEYEDSLYGILCLSS